MTKHRKLRIPVYLREEEKALIEAHALAMDDTMSDHLRTMAVKAAREWEAGK